MARTPIRGTTGANWIDVAAVLRSPLIAAEVRALDGADGVVGADGDDLVYGGEGDDVLYGNDGADSLYGQAGRDLLYGGKHDDLLDGSDDEDVLWGGDGADTLKGGAGNDQLFGDAGNDYVNAGAGDNTAWGGSGDDTLLGGVGHDYLIGEGGADSINAGDGNNTIEGGDDNDTIRTGSGRDMILGGAGDDTIIAGDGTNEVDGGTGHDRITAGSGADVISGGTGNDIIDAGDGRNAVYGGTGDDRITTGSGDDVVTGDDGDDGINAGNGANAVHGGAGNDTLTTGSGADTVTGDAGTDSIDSGAGRDQVHGGEANDTILAGGDADLVTGDGGDDSLDGGTGNDSIYGGSGQDNLLGAAGDDFLMGEDGNDTIDGGLGADTVYAGSGDDLIVVRRAGNGIGDLINGEGGADTLRYEMTRAEWMLAAVQADVAGYTAQLADQSGQYFTFGSNGLTIINVENAVARVDGVDLTFADDAVTAVDDIFHVAENGSVAGSVVLNDTVPDLIWRVATLSLPSKGLLTFNPDGSFSYDTGTAFDYLGAGEHATVTFRYRVTDADRDTGDATVSLVVTGSNDGPTVDTAEIETGDVTERADNAADENTGDLTTTGSFAFADLDLTDTHSVTVAVRSVTGAAAALGALTPIISNAATGDGAGTVSWTYAVAAGALDYLAANQIITQVYTVTMRDGRGATATKDVTITLTGTNDAPTVSAAAATGGVTENPDGSTGENSGYLTHIGSFAFADVDLIDTHLISVAAPTVTGAAAALGTFTPSLSDAATGDGAGTVGWTFRVAANALDYLSAGQTITQVYAVSVADGNGGVVTKDVTITLTGTNDAPTGGTVVTTSLTERADGAGNENTGDLTKNFNFAFRDVDLADTHIVSSAFVAAESTAPELGSLAVTLNYDSTGTGAGQARGAYRVAAGALDYLSAGQDVTQTYRVSFDDGHGGIGTRDVVVTLTGTNDAPTVDAAVAASAVVERTDGTADENGSAIVATGSFAFSDVDLADTHTASAVLRSVTGAASALGSFVPGIADAATGDGIGSVGWTFTVAAGALDYLAAGQAITQVYTVTLQDSVGASLTKDVTVTLTGTNDAPTVDVSEIEAGAVTEKTDGIIGENSGNLTASGSFAFGDVDLTDTHSISVAAPAVTGATAALGTFTPTITNIATGAGAGAVSWSYSVAASALDYLAAGETVNQTYTVRVADTNGGSVTKDVTITLTGTNDAPTGGNLVTTSLTERTDGAANENTGDLIKNFNFAFRDVDLADTHTVSASFLSAQSTAAELGSLAVSLYSDSTGTGAGLVRNEYRVAAGALDYLAAGQSVTQTYRVSFDDGHGGVGTRDVEITLVGTNDVPTDIQLMGDARVDEGTASVGGRFVVVVAGTDPDATDVLAYTVSDARFEVVGGALFLKEGATLDYETEASVDLSITATDPVGASITRDFTIAVGDVDNDATSLAGKMVHYSYLVFTPPQSYWETDVTGGAGVELPKIYVRPDDASTAQIDIQGDKLVVDFYGAPRFGAVGTNGFVFTDTYDKLADITGFTIRSANMDTGGITLSHDANSVSLNWPGQNFEPGMQLVLDLDFGTGNHAPGVDDGIAAQSVAEDMLWTFAVPATAFSDAEGDALSYGATLASGAALPAWLSFDAGTRTFTGTPPQDFNGVVALTVTADDGGGEPASATFNLTVTPVHDAPAPSEGARSAMLVDAGATVADDVDNGYRYNTTGWPSNNFFVLDGTNSGIDIIADFVSTQDTILLTGFGSGVAEGTLSRLSFQSGTDSVFADSDRRFFYETDSGALWYDADGSGAVHAAFQVATLTGAQSLAATDLFVVG